MRTFKCALLFFTAALIHSIGHDATKALTAWSLGIPNTLHHFFILYDLPAGSLRDFAFIAAAPACFSAAVGLGAAWAYGHVESAAARFFAVYLGAIGAVSVLGALMTVAWDGNLHELAVAFAVPPVILVAISISSGLFLALVLWQVGVRLQPPMGTLVLPFALATLARALVYQPLPPQMVLILLMGSAQWLVAIAGSFWARRRATADAAAATAPVNLAWSAMALPVLLISVVRLLTIGIRFE